MGASTSKPPPTLGPAAPAPPEPSKKRQPKAPPTPRPLKRPRRSCRGPAPIPETPVAVLVAGGATAVVRKRAHQLTLQGAHRCFGQVRAVTGTPADRAPGEAETPKLHEKWIVKDGLQFGADFVLYRRSPDVFHAEYCVVVAERDEIAPRRALQGERAALAFVAQQHENITMPGCAPRDRACVVKRLGAAAGGFAESAAAAAPERRTATSATSPSSASSRTPCGSGATASCTTAPRRGAPAGRRLLPRRARGRRRGRARLPPSGVDGLVLTRGMAEGRYSFSAWLEPHAEERIAFDFEVALPPYADGGVALGLFLGGKRARNFKGPSPPFFTRFG
ncbi:hypothetical protein SO694_00004267 [Aureococcus anophagefferens]|uniref:tRNA-intron lyase n=1 Tax=Aureococcus anophagefferens TaxID=44056 RepID=A0ABR1G905_AURAN